MHRKIKNSIIRGEFKKISFRRYKSRRGKLNKCIQESNNTINKVDLIKLAELNPTICEYFS